MSSRSRRADRPPGRELAGARGLALCFIDHAAELPYFRDEVLHRLVDMGVRRPG
ncbi:hypothetical protein WMF27_41795 [Sorangium sp. So ce281]|uniref:hypothetical protein n=1 Tax=unclassified Sorangium TaxID=2621164 RepID=UPI003F5DE933